MEPFRMLVIAPSQYGKSYMISQFILERLKRKQFSPKRVIVISKTFKSDPSQRMLIDCCVKKVPRFEETNCFEDVGEGIELLQQVYEVNKRLKDSGKEYHQWVYVMDDMISESVLTSRKSPLLGIQALQRHYGISSVLSLQNYRQVLSVPVRNQMSIIAVGRLTSQSAVEDLLTEYDCGLAPRAKESKQAIMGLWEDAIQHNDGHGFLFIYPYVQCGRGKF